MWNYLWNGFYYLLHSLVLNSSVAIFFLFIFKNPLFALMWYLHERSNSFMSEYNRMQLRLIFKVIWKNYKEFLREFNTSVARSEQFTDSRIFVELECAIVNKKTCASQISRVCWHFISGCSNSARRKSGKCREIFRRSFIFPHWRKNAPYSDLLFKSMRKFYKARKIARCNPRRGGNVRAREFESRFGSQFAKWEKAPRKHYLCEKHAPALWASHQRLHSVLRRIYWFSMAVWPR